MEPFHLVHEARGRSAPLGQASSAARSELSAIVPPRRAERQKTGQRILVGWWRTVAAEGARRLDRHEASLNERALATVTDYDEMIGALRARMAELGVTNETIGAIAGLAGGYVGKLLGPSRIKNLGPLSLG